ncbi:MAG: sodium:solute symporter [Candidatus Latescibacterota bacterium]|nr:sodium:solute symporter [Candidatus Latescibacterota bacterium]
MHWVDWTVVGLITVFFVVLAYSTKKYTQSTSDFLAANRLAGRYLLTMADGVAGLGAVSIIARFQMVYKSGFAPNWWDQLQAPVLLLIMLTGWVAYRYRETRAMTLGQFLEMRYGRRFRSYAATICWISGIINFGIFPSVGANFFIHYTGMPETYAFLSLQLPTYQTLLIVLLGLSLYFTFAGGQIAVLVTDFFQSFFVNIVLATILILILVEFPLDKIFEGLQIADPGKSLLDPFDTGNIEGFDPFYFLISLFGLVINRNAWQGSQAYQVSAKTPHEQKMAGVLGQFRGFTLLWALTLLPLVAYMIMHHPDYTDWATQVNGLLEQIPDEQVRDQMVTPITMTLWMPVGLMGAFAAVMFAAFISTHDTYLHSWGSIFVQDVYLPIRGKEIDTRQHLKLLRLSILGVAVFIFLFSTYYRQTQDILLFFALTGAFWLGGAGVVIVGGLYTAWGTTRGAYAGLTAGTILATAGMICEHWWIDWTGEDFALTGQEVYFFAMCCSWTLYLIFSLLDKKRFNLDKMLHRGDYVIASDHSATGGRTVRERFNWHTALGINADFTRGDKLIYGFTIVKSMGLFALWLIMTITAFTTGVSIQGWTTYHYWVNAVFFIVLTLAIMVWLTIGGMRDVFQLFRDLRTAKRDFSDDGTVRDHDFDVEEPAMIR